MNEFQSSIIALAEITQFEGNGGAGEFLYLYHSCKFFLVTESRILLAFNIPISLVEIEWLIARTSDLLSHLPFKNCSLQQHANHWWLYQDYCWDWLKMNLPEALSAQRRLALWLSEEPCGAGESAPAKLASFKMLGNFV